MEDAKDNGILQDKVSVECLEGNSNGNNFQHIKFHIETKAEREA